MTAKQLKLRMERIEEILSVAIDRLDMIEPKQFVKMADYIDLGYIEAQVHVAKALVKDAMKEEE